MIEISKIRNSYFNEGKSISQISKESGYDRKTVKMYIEKEDWNKEHTEKKELEFPKLDSFKAVIDQWLYDDKKAKRKQRHTAKRVYVRLTKEYQDDFKCSYRTVAGYVAIKKKEIFGQQSKGTLPLEHIPGEAQADFGDAEYYENGKLYDGKYLNLSFPYSNKGYLQLFKGENQECLFEGLIRIFEHIGGVPQRIWFDNPSTIVIRVLKMGGRDLTDDFIRFKEHYGFEAAFCNVSAGHEKGNVENKVGYHRRNLLVPVPKFCKLAIFNEELLELCEKDSEREHYRKDAAIEELYNEDKAALMELPRIPLDVSKYMTVKTNNYGRFYLNNGIHEYSVSPKYANSRVQIKITANEVIPLDDSQREIVRHERFYGSNKQQSMNWLPYLTQLSRCPSALKYTGIYQMLPLVVKNYLEKCDKSEKGKLLQAITALTKKNGFDSAIETVNSALAYGTVDIDSLVNLYKRTHDNTPELAPINLSENIPILTKVTPNLSVYDARLETAGVQ